MGKHDPELVASVVLTAATIANVAVSYQMKADVRRAGVPKEQFPKAQYRNDWRPQRWLWHKHRELYPGDVLPLLYSVLAGVVILAASFCLYRILNEPQPQRR